MLKLAFLILAVVVATTAAGAAELPAICTENAAQVMAGTAPMVMATPDAAHGDLMAGMAAMDKDMMVGGTATDADVAFVCSMIPHHQGAIDMAKAELSHGDDPWARQMAQNVIDAQTKEIAAMLAWLDKQAK